MFTGKKETMLVAIKIKSKQLNKLQKLVKNEKLSFAFVSSRSIAWIDGKDCEVTLNCYSGDPGDLFDLGQKYQKIPDDIIMGL